MINCYVIDDEQPAINLLVSFIKKTPFLNLIGTNTNALNSYLIFQEEKIDLLFLDIQMPDITGIEFLQSLENKPLVIFTTAYDQYALQGFELDIIDYLIKPIPFQRFLRAANKASKAMTIGSNINTDFIIIKTEYKSKKIAADDIIYIEGLKDYVKIFTRSGMELTRLNLKGIEKRLPLNQFIRIHRSFIVSISKIQSFQKSQLSVGIREIPIGETYRERLIEKLS